MMLSTARSTFWAFAGGCGTSSFDNICGFFKDLDGAPRILQCLEVFNV